MFQLENLVREMQDLEHGVPVRSQKLFLTSIPAAFMGQYSIGHWLSFTIILEGRQLEFYNFPPDSLRLSETENDELCLEWVCLCLSSMLRYCVTNIDFM